MTGWKKIKLGDISDMCLGKMLDKEKNKGEFHPYLANINVRWGSFDLTNLNIMRFEESEQDRYGLKYGDIVICEGGEPGRCAIWKEEHSNMKFQKALHRVRIKGDFSNQFVYYRFLLAGRNGELENYFIGSTIKHLIGFTLKEVEFPYPTFKEQQKIASVLSALDSKIELNKRINNELEAMAKTLYDYWFVQFDFPDQHDKPYKSSGGKMQWNDELKRIVPEGWKVEKLDAVVERILDHRGKTPLKLGGDWSNEGEGIIALSAKNVKGGQLVNLDQANRVNLEMYEKWMPEKLKDGDILMTSEAPLGEFYFLLNNTNYCMSQRLFGIRANQSKVIPSYLYYELSKGNGFSQIIGSKSGSTVFGIRQDELRKIKVLNPALAIQSSFDKIVFPMLAKIRVLVSQNQKLAELRDWLLPMLMNGQVTVRAQESEIA